MTNTSAEHFTIRAHEAQLLAQIIRIGQGQTLLCEIGPRTVFVVTVQDGERPEEIVAQFDNVEAAKETAEALERQMRAFIETDGAGPRLASRDGVTLQ